MLRPESFKISGNCAEVQIAVIGDGFVSTVEAGKEVNWKFKYDILHYFSLVWGFSR